MSAFRHSLHQTIEERRAVEARARARRAYVVEHIDRRAAVAKVVRVLDEFAVQRLDRNPYIEPELMILHVERLSEDERRRVTERACVPELSEETWEREVVGVYLERARGPRFHGVRESSLQSLQELGGELSRLIESAPRGEAWVAHAMLHDRAVHAEISLRARAVAS